MPRACVAEQQIRPQFEFDEQAGIGLPVIEKARTAAGVSIGTN